MKNKKKGIAIAIAMACVVVFVIFSAHKKTAESVQSYFLALVPPIIANYQALITKEV